MTLGVIAMVPALGATVLRVLLPSSDLLAQLASVIPYGLSCWLPAVLLLVFATVTASRAARSSVRMLSVLLLTVSLAGLTASIGWLAPAFVSDRKPITSAPLSVVTLNIAGSASQAAVAAAAEEADIVVLVEASRAWLDRMPADFLEQRPHVATATPEQYGSVIVSRYPIVSVERLPAGRFPQIAAVVATPQFGNLEVVAVHLCNPLYGNGCWAAEGAQLRNWLGQRSDGTPTVVTGDFNAVNDHSTMQALYRDGFREAADLTGSGFVRTWPNSRWMPPLIGIDHLLLGSGLTATRFETFAVTGSDHLGLRVAVASSR